MGTQPGRMICWRVRLGIKRRRGVSDVRRRGMLRPPPSACTLGSCCKLPNYKVHGDSTWLFTTRGEKMPFADVKIMYQQGSPSFKKHIGCEFSWLMLQELKWHAGQFSVFAGEVKQGNHESVWTCLSSRLARPPDAGRRPACSNTTRWDALS